jgi:phosphoglycerate dehydrogenase-like enzyme
MNGRRAPVVVVATPLEDELVARVRAAAPGARYDATLLPTPRYRGDHRGDPGFARSPEALERWSAMLADAEIVLGIPGESTEGLRDLIARAPALRWVQSMFAGGGETVRGAALDAATLARVAFTTTSGVHGTMLAEYAFLGVLALRKDFRRLERARVERTWQRFPMGELFGSTIVIVGTGHIGTSIARVARAFGMRAVGVARTSDPRAEFDEIVPLVSLVDVCARADVVALALPGTLATRGLFGEREIAALRPDAVVVNVGRGTTVDQPELTRALVAGRIGGAVLDVFEPEPLPPDDPLWSLDNVLISPHTATLSIHENERIVELFLDNLARDARGEPLRNRVDLDEFY